MEKKIAKAIPKDKKCRCGKKITHHHYLCNDCWISDKKVSKLRKKAMEKNKSQQNKNTHENCSLP